MTTAEPAIRAPVLAPRQPILAPSSSLSLSLASFHLSKNSEQRGFGKRAATKASKQASKQANKQSNKKEREGKKGKALTSLRRRTNDLIGT
jgi:hypothetical protein